MNEPLAKSNPVLGFLDAERVVYDAILAAERPLIGAGRLVQLNYIGKGKYSRQLDFLGIPYVVGNANANPAREMIFVDRKVLLERLGRTHMVCVGLLQPGSGAHFAALLRSAKIAVEQCGDTRFICRADALSIEAKLLRCAAPEKGPAPAPPLLTSEVEAVKEALEELRRQTVGAHRILFNELRHQRAGLDRLLAELGLAGISPETDPPCSPASARPAA